MSKKKKRGKIGRPKLPKSKRKPIKKAKYKGIRYITKHLRGTYNKKTKKWSGGWKQYRLDKKAASLRAQEILSSLEGSKVTVKGINSLQRIGREERRLRKLPPELPLYLIDPKPYYALVDYPGEILLTDSTVTFISKIIPKGLPPIIGGTEIEYSDYFKSFVDYINRQVGLLKSESGREYSSGDDEWQVMCVGPIPDYDIKGRWIVKIIACNESGQEVDYGFNPLEPEAQPIDLNMGEEVLDKKRSGKKKKKDTSSGSSVSTTSDIDKQIELERLKLASKKLDDAKELLKEKVITFDQYQKLVKGL